MQLHARHLMAVALAAAVTLTSLNLTPAQAAAPKASGQQATENTSTDFSAHRRHYRRGNAAAFGAVLGVFGTIAAIAAAEQYRNGYYYGDPYYYGPGPYYYGGGPYYGGGYYGGYGRGYYGGHGGHGGHHHHRH